MGRMMELEIPELTQILKKLREIRELITRRESFHDLPEWLDLRTAAKLKGIPFDTVKDRRELWPPKSQMIGGVHRFRYKAGSGFNLTILTY